MENQIYEFIVENLGINGWDLYTSLSPEEQKDLLEELGFSGTSGEDEGPEYDSAGFTEEDRIVNGQYRNREN